ncbi:MAG TPA: DUF2207 domain-containing protein, partial [Phototrophicaceae bacterium]|nr:DUF2207 domain-containing protein [Phototrophicaceae bacterium]
EGGQAMQASCSGNSGTFCAQTSDDGKNLEVDYYFFHAVSDTTEQIQLSYTVNGGLRIYSGGDQLWWTAIPADNNGFSVGSSTITVQLPDGYAPRTGVDPVVTYGAPANVEVNGTTIIAKATGQINDGTDFEIRVQYPHDPGAQAPAWQAGYDRQAQIGPVISVISIALAVLIAVGGGLFLYSLYLRKGRDPKIGPVPTYLSDPPSDLPPALVGTLVDERADPRDAISTIIDLAHRGYLAIEEAQTEGVFGLGRSSTFTFKRSDKPLEGLRDFEQTLMNRLFGMNRLERTMDSLRNSFYTVIAQMQSQLYNDLVTDELFATNPDSTRTMWSALGIIILVLGGVIGFFLLGLTDQYGFAILLPPIAIGIVGVIALIIGPAMPAKTRKGAEESAKWKAFYEYLRHLEKYAKVEDVSEQFEKYLPYAVAFGLDNSWIHKFSQVPSMPIPYWYYPTYIGPYHGGFIAGSPMPYVPFNARGGMMGGDIAHAAGGVSLDKMSGNLSGGLSSISNGLSGMLNSASSAMTSRPSSSGSSGSWSRGGGSFSGGGRGGFGGGGHAGGGGSRGFR